MSELIREASMRSMMNLFYVHGMNDGCLMVTNSGGRRRYVVGRLDSGSVFVEGVLSE